MSTFVAALMVGAVVVVVVLYVLYSYLDQVQIATFFFFNGCSLRLLLS